MFPALTRAVIIALITSRILEHNMALADNIEDVWSSTNHIISFFWNKCFSNAQDWKNAAIITKECITKRGLRALDRALSRDVIQISDNIVLVKQRNGTEDDDLENRLTTKTPSTEGNVELLEKLNTFLKTRRLRITFKGFPSSTFIGPEARGRHKNALGQMLMFGLVAAGLIVIPMGFQFLAVLGGKALLLAKLALLLTSIQGLKKIATSNVNYGLYSTHSMPWQYDRKLHFEDPYTTYYSPDASSAVGEQYNIPASALPAVYSLHPRGEDHLATI